MSLPSISLPAFRTTIPSTGKEIEYRPFLVKEEKVLYIALESGAEKDIFSAVIKILQSCILTPNIDVLALTTFDVEYLFLNIRARSVGEQIDLRLKHSGEDNKCNFIHQVQINIDEIKVDRTGEKSNKVMLTDKVGVVLRYPSVALAMKAGQDPKKEDVTKMFELVADCMVSVFDEQNVYDSATRQEMIAFIEDMTKDQFERVMDFFKNAPKLRHVIEWKCPQCDTEERIVLEGLQGFFG